MQDNPSQENQESKENQEVCNTAEEREERILITPLKEEDDWHEIREDLESLEEEVEPSPWASWEYYYEWWRHFGRDKAVWLVQCHQGEMPLATAFWMEERQERRGVTFHALRSMDTMAMRTPPYLYARGREKEAVEAMTRALPMLVGQCRAELLTLYRQDEKALTPWLHELEAQQFRYSRRVFTHSDLIDFPETFDQYKSSLRHSLIKNIERSERKIETDFGQPMRLEHLHGNLFADPRFEKIWPCFERLRNHSWQVENAREKELVDTRILTRFTRMTGELWSRKKALDLTLILIKGQPVSFLLGISMGDRYYAYLTGYDREYRSYGVGALAFLKALEQAHARGERLVELGGEGSEWKREYATRQSSLLQVEIPLPGIKGRIWSLFQKLKHGDENEEVR